LQGTNEESEEESGSIEGAEDASNVEGSGADQAEESGSDNEF